MSRGRRYLLVGGSGTVGRSVAAQLSAEPRTEVFLASRNRVLLEGLSQRLGCETLVLDVTSGAADPCRIPKVDTVVNLTFPISRHPRVALEAVETSTRFFLSYLDHNPEARLVHTSTWVVMEDPTHRHRLRRRLQWTDGYVLAKSAAERALHRNWRRDRMCVVRLGNVVTPDSMFGIGMLRALAAGTVRDPNVLSTQANLCSTAELAEVLVSGELPPLLLTDRMAGWTWAEALESVRGALRARGIPVSSLETGTVTPSAPGTPHSIPRWVPGLIERLLWLTPVRLESARLDSPAKRRLVNLIKRVQSAGSPGMLTLPPALPAYEPIAEAQRDRKLLDTVSAELAKAFIDRGYGVPGANLSSRVPCFT